MTDRSETVGIRMTPDEKTKFQNHVDESEEFSSLSRFFRVIAHRAVASEDDQSTLETDEIVEAVDDALAPLTTQLDEIENHILSIDSTVRDDDTIDKLARDIYSALPTHRSGDELPDLDKENLAKYQNQSDYAFVRAVSTPFLWAKYFDEDYQDVRRACARMLEYYPDVNFVGAEIGGASKHIPEHNNIDIPDPDHQHGGSANADSNRSSEGTEGVYERRYFKTEAQ